MGLLKSLRRALHTKRTLKFRMKGGDNCGDPEPFAPPSIATSAPSVAVGGRRRRRTGRRRTGRRRTGRRRTRSERKPCVKP